MADTAAPAKEEEPLSKEEALKRFLARKAAGPSPPADIASPPDEKPAKRSLDDDQPEEKSPAQDTGDGDAKRLKECKQPTFTFPVSRKSHFDLVPGHQNTTTKEPMMCDARLLCLACCVAACAFR